MPKFVVTIHRTVEHSCEVTVSASDEDAASSKAEQLVADTPAKYEWEFEDESYEVYEVNEE